jgi:phage terminase small subunit
MVDFNASAAYVRAGYAPKAANVNSAMLMAKHSIKGEITRLKAELSEKTAITIEDCQKEHRRLQALAEAKGDLTTATRNLELQYKTIGAYVDRQDNRTAGLSINISRREDSA